MAKLFCAESFWKRFPRRALRALRLGIGALLHTNGIYLEIINSMAKILGAENVCTWLYNFQIISLRMTKGRPLRSLKHRLGNAKKAVFTKYTYNESFFICVLQRRLLWFIYSMREAVPRPRVWTSDQTLGGSTKRGWHGWASGRRPRGWPGAI